ncbi:glutaredoxin-like protein [Halorhabdus utahensis DSM 12940]|mgnify:CR=1 FL=1|uniref:Glutaredoxin-like protein n=1 Tax=Halorhabdus utahensis (strain DSM 12940 / JCM 11049 / AX-2) TaxID=519442 RepID=C7NPU4_HALUD|nr:glutaredoxin family protein [Halorhabdus utahensis]ACV10391.1 glutaredoxin-like protein [Halorhabdus utahensis DSM 12940]
MSTETPTDAETVTEHVEGVIEENDVVLFMKGTPQRPQCGFSQRAVGLIRAHCEDFETVDVLDSLPEYRAALEAQSGWETIPQTYVDGEFVGGSDILAEHEQRGDLAETLAP